MNKRLAEQEKEIAELKQQNAQLQWQIRQLNDKLSFFLRNMYGRKSEQLDPRQLELLLTGMQKGSPEEPDDDPPPESPSPKSRKKRKPRRERLPENLPEQVEYIDPEEVKANPDEYKCIDQDEHIQLDMLPTRFFIKRTIRRKYVKKADRSAAPVIAPAPKRLIDNSYASVALLVHIILGKYVDHLPLYRQEQIFKHRYGIDLSRKTMCDWMWRIADWLRIIYDEMKEEIRDSGYIQADETVIRYLDPGNRKSRQGYLWVYHSPGTGVVFQWHTSRASTCIGDMLENYKGAVQCDGYQSYRTFAKDKEEIELYGCWAHVRRKFFEAQGDSVFACWMLRQVQLLYGIEARLREQHAGASECEAGRQAESRMIIERIEKALKLKTFSFRPKSQTGQAIAYTLTIWEDLKRYLTSGIVHIDNNQVENTIRPTAIGKKNWLFFGGKEAGWRSAVLYSILESCRKLDISQQEYLTYVLSRLPHITNHQARKLTPLKWALNKQRNVA